jgi:putative ABC transport system permease protein
MRITDAVKISWKGLTRSRMRTFLTMLGIIIGITSVILLMSLGQSAQDYILAQVQGIGSNLIIINPTASSSSSKFQPPSAVLGVIIKTLRDNDIAALKREPAISAVAAEVRGIARAVYGNNDTAITYVGVNKDFITAVNITTSRGVWFDQNDIDSLNHVALIGKNVATNLFGSADPIGKSIRIKNLPFQVIGLLSTNKGSLFAGDLSDVVIMPSSVAQKQLQGIDYYSVFIVKYNDRYDLNFVKSRITNVLMTDHGITDANKADFQISTQDDLLSILGNITSILSIFLTSIAAISLVVGGIGIMNIMLVSVIERTKEIGLRKAVGATNSDIRLQFLCESVILTFFGGAIGIALGAGLSYLAYLIVNKFGGIVWTFALPLNAVLLAVFVSSFIGLVFGIYPASKAAKKNPIEALHYE